MENGNVVPMGEKIIVNNQNPKVGSYLLNCSNWSFGHMIITSRQFFKMIIHISFQKLHAKILQNHVLFTANMDIAKANMQDGCLEIVRKHVKNVLAMTQRVCYAVM